MSGGRAGMGLLLLLAGDAAAQSVRGCPFETAALAAALAAEAPGELVPPIDVTCTDGAATVTIDRGSGRGMVTRVVDLIDVPAALAPRVVALVAVAAVHEPLPPPLPPPLPLPLPPPMAPGMVTDRPMAPPSPRVSLLGGGWHLTPVGVVARGLARIHDGTTTLWGAGAAATLGPASIGVMGAGTRIEHALGTLTPWVVAAEAGLTVACAGAVCGGLRAEVGRVAVASSVTDPVMVSARALSATYLHGAAEVSVSTHVGGVEVAATAAVGAGRGVIARADQDAVAVVAGWTLTGALEVRR